LDAGEDVCQVNVSVERGQDLGGFA
jgi:hypothetical protein